MKKLTKSILMKLIKEEIENVKLGAKSMTRSAQARAEKERAKDIASGDSLGDVTSRERAILKDVEDILTKIAEKDDLNKYRNQLQSLLKRLLKRSPDSEDPVATEDSE